MGDLDSLPRSIFASPGPASFRTMAILAIFDLFGRGCIENHKPCNLGSECVVKVIFGLSRSSEDHKS
jgi:hypothetical protein